MRLQAFSKITILAQGTKKLMNKNYRKITRSSTDHHRVNVNSKMNKGISEILSNYFSEQKINKINISRLFSQKTVWRLFNLVYISRSKKITFTIDITLERKSRHMCRPMDKCYVT